MAGRRDQIRMTEDERRSFLEEQRIVTVASLGPNGRPHLMPLWYVVDGDDLLGWTYAASQKTKNLERDPRATLSIEDGEQYQELRGVSMECDVDIDRDAAPYGLRVMERYVGAGADALVEAQAPKRVGLRFRPTKVVTWDHTKLGGTY